MPIEKFLIDWCLCRRSWCSYVDTLYKFTRRQLRLSPRFDCDWHIFFRAGAFYLTATIGLGWIWWNRKKKINDLKKKTTRIERRRWQNNFAPHDTTSKFLNSLTVPFWILKGCVLYYIRRPREEARTNSSFTEYSINCLDLKRRKEEANQPCFINDNN